jgi:enoyl-CoA hydratase
MASSIEIRGPDQGVATILLNRTHRRNALTFEMGRELETAVEKLNLDSAVRVVLLRGAGEAFCSGADFELLRGFRALGRAEAEATMLDFYQRFLSIQALAVPSIAVIQGGAIGAGCCLALACDLRLAATDAKLCFNFVRLGLSPGMAATFHLPQLCGQARALELLTTGRAQTGEEAAAFGLVNRAVSPEALEAEAWALAQQIASAAPLAVRMTKHAVRSTPCASEDGAALAQALRFEAQSQAACFASRDYAEAMTAVVEKRPPVFRGE